MKRLYLLQDVDKEIYRVNQELEALIERRQEITSWTDDERLAVELYYISERGISWEYLNDGEKYQFRANAKTLRATLHALTGVEMTNDRVLKIVQTVKETT